jgi:putative ABC transport system substrate-binding protein
MRRREFIAGFGSAAAWPARAQQPARVPVIGFLHGRFPDALADRWVAAFQQGLADEGFIVGENVAIEFRWANLQFGKLPSLVSDLINRQVTVIFAADSRGPLRAAQAATKKIPIVFYYGGDPVKDGFVTSLNRPGGNMTGLTDIQSELGPKRLALIHEMVPQAETIGFLTERGENTATVEHQNAIRAAARSLGLELVEFEVVGPVLMRAFATFFERQARAVLVDNVATLFAAAPAIVRLAQQYKIPTIYPTAGAARAGGLASYGSRDVLAILRQVARQYVARILKGAQPADLPVQQSTKFEFVINLKTAKALGVTIPETLLATADEVIQ